MLRSDGISKPLTVDKVQAQKASYWTFFPIRWNWANEHCTKMRKMSNWMLWHRVFVRACIQNVLCGCLIKWNRIKRKTWFHWNAHNVMFTMLKNAQWHQTVKHLFNRPAWKGTQRFNINISKCNHEYLCDIGFIRYDFNQITLCGIHNFRSGTHLAGVGNGNITIEAIVSTLNRWGWCCQCRRRL